MVVLTHPILVAEGLPRVPSSTAKAVTSTGHKARVQRANGTLAPYVNNMVGMYGDRAAVSDGQHSLGVHGGARALEDLMGWHILQGFTPAFRRPAGWHVRQGRSVHGAWAANVCTIHLHSVQRTTEASSSRKKSTPCASSSPNVNGAMHIPSTAYEHDWEEPLRPWSQHAGWSPKECCHQQPMHASAHPTHPPSPTPHPPTHTRFSPPPSLMAHSAPLCLHGHSLIHHPRPSKCTHSGLARTH